MFGAVRYWFSTWCEVSLTQMPWNFKIFYGLLLDRLSFFGSRRKGWIFGETLLYVKMFARLPVYPPSHNLAVWHCCGLCFDSGRLSGWLQKAEDHFWLELIPADFGLYGYSCSWVAFNQFAMCACGRLVGHVLQKLEAENLAHEGQFATYMMLLMVAWFKIYPSDSAKCMVGPWQVCGLMGWHHLTRE